MPRRVDLDPPRVGVEEQTGGARSLDLVVDGRILTWLELACQEQLLGSVHEPAAHLVYVGLLADDPRVLVDLGLPAPGLDHDLDPCSMTGLERADRERREVALGVAQERGAPAEHR